MTTPSQAPAMSREEWEAKLTELCNECDVDSFVSLKKEILDAIMSIQAEVEMLRAEVERLRGCHVHRLYFDIDPHNFSPRPCSTCDGISAVTKNDFGCKALRVEKARQPK